MSSNGVQIDLTPPKFTAMLIGVLAAEAENLRTDTTDSGDIVGEIFRSVCSFELTSGSVPGHGCGPKRQAWYQSLLESSRSSKWHRSVSDWARDYVD